MQHDEPNTKEEFIVTHIGRPLGDFKDSHPKSLLNSLLPPYRKRKKTAALCIIAGFLIGVIGMNSTTSAWGENDNAKSSTRKTSIIVPTNAVSQDINNDTQPESFESYQLRILRNQNHLQAEKIKAMREELLEATQKLHELKPHLFKQGDPADQAKIAELTQQLGEKESYINQVQTTKDQLEKDLNAARKKLNEMETVKEALAAMVEKQRASKEQNLSNFKKQLEEIHSSAENEKSSLLKKVRSHEAEYDKLNKTIVEKSNTINRLDNVATKLNETIASKDHELLNLEGQTLALYDEILLLTEVYTNSNSALNDQVQTLVAALDWEKTQTKQLQSFKEEMNWLSDIFAGTKSILADEIKGLQESLELEKAKNEELSFLKGDLESRRIELALLLHTHGTQKKEMENYIQQLTAATEYEQTRTQELEQEMLVLLSHQESGHRYAEALESLLGELDDMLAAKHSELEDVASDHTVKVGTLLSHLDFSERTADDHKSHVQNLQSKMNALLTKQKKKEITLRNSLKDATASYEQQKDQLASLEERFDLISQNSQALRLEMLSNTVDLASKDQRIKQLEAQQDILYVQLSTQIAQIGSDLDKESEHSINVEALLHDSVDYTKSLSETLGMHKGSLADKEKALQALSENHQQLKNQLETEIQRLNTELHEKSTYNLSLQDQIQILELSLQDQIQSLQQHQSDILTSHASSLADRQNLDSEIQRLNSELHEKSAHNLSLQDQIQSLQQNQSEILTSHASSLSDRQDLDSELQRLNSELGEKSAHNLSLQDQIQALLQNQSEILTSHASNMADRQNLDNEIQRLKSDLDENSAITLALSDQIQFLQSREAEFLSSHENHLKDKQDLAAEIHRLSSELEDQTLHNQSLRDQIQSLLEKHHEQIDVTNIALESKDNSESELQEHIALLNQQLEELNQSIAQERTRASSIENELDKMLSKYDAEVGRSRDLEEQIDAMNASVSEKGQILSLMESRVSTTDLDNQGLAGENHRLLEQAENLENLYNQSREEIEQLSGIIAQMRSELANAGNNQSDLTALELQIQYHLEELERKDNRIALLEEKHASLLEENTTSQSDLDDRLHRISEQLEAERARSKALQDDLNFARSNYTRERGSLQNLDKIYRETASKVAQLEDQLEQHKSELSHKDVRIQNLSDAKSHLKSTLSELYQNKISALENELQSRINVEEELREAIANYHDAKDRSTLLEQQLAAFDDEHNHRQQIEADLEKAHARYQDIVNHTQELELKAAALEQENAASERNRAELERTLAEYQGVHAHAKNLERHLNALEDEGRMSATYQEELDKLSDEYHVVRNYAQDLEQRVASLEEENRMSASYQEELNRTRSEYQNVNHYAQNLEQRLAAMENENRTAASYQEELNRVRSEYQVVNSYSQDLESQVAALQEEKARFHAVHNELDGLKHEYGLLQNQAQALSQQLEDAREFAAEKERAHTIAEERTIKTLTHNLELSSENQRLLREKSQLEQRLHDNPQRVVDRQRNEPDTAEDYSQSRLQRMNSSRSSTRP